MSSLQLHYNVIIMVSKMALHYRLEQPPNVSPSVTKQLKKKKKPKVEGNGINALNASASLCGGFKQIKRTSANRAPVSVEVARQIHTYAT